MSKRPRIGVVGSSNVDLVTYVDRMPAWLFVAVSGLVVYVMAVHLYPMAGS